MRCAAQGCPANGYQANIKRISYLREMGPINGAEAENKDNGENRPQGFGKVYSEYYRGVVRRLAYLTGSIQAAEDIAQEVFMKYYKSPPEHGNTAGWLYRVASNLAFNHLRDQETKRRKETAALYDGDGNVISIEDAAIANFEVRLTRKVLESLPSRDRICLLLKFSGYKYSEIAEATGIERNSVGKILERAQAKFKERFEKEAKLT